MEYLGLVAAAKPVGDRDTPEDDDEDNRNQRDLTKRLTCARDHRILDLLRVDLLERLQPFGIEGAELVGAPPPLAFAMTWGRSSAGSAASVPLS